jgi:hypothetical protein
MKGFFVSISLDRKRVFIYSLKYSVSDENATTEGIWKPTILVDKDHCYELIPTPGYPLSIDKFNNEYFKKFCQTGGVSCNGWLQRGLSTYKVTRYKNDRMFLLLAMNMETYPVDITESCLFRALKRSCINQDSKIIFMNEKNQQQSSVFFSSLEEKFDQK